MKDDFEFISDEFIEEHNITVYNKKLNFIKKLSDDDSVNVFEDEDKNEIVLKKFYSKNKFLREIDRYNILKNSKYVVKFLGIGLDRKSIVLKYYKNDTLTKYINENTLSDEKLDNIFKDLIEILKVLEEKEITHYDLKPSNLLLDDNYKILVCDFDTSREDLYKYINTTSKIGTLYYTAPEVLSNTQIKKKNLTDIFSMGKVLFYLFTKQESIDFNSYEIIFDRIIPFPYNIIIDKMIKHNPFDRYSNANEIEEEYLSIRNYILGNKIENLQETIIFKYSENDIDYFNKNTLYMNYIFYYTIISKKFDYKFISIIFFKETDFNFKSLLKLNQFDYKLFKLLIKVIIQSKKVAFIVADAQDLDKFISEKVDVVLCNSAFWQFQNQNRVLIAISNILKDNGKLIFNLNQQFFDFGKPEPNQKLLINTIFSEMKKRGYDYINKIKPKIDKEKFEELFSHAGYNLEKTEVINIGPRKLDDFLNFFTIPATATFFENVSKEDQEQILNSVYDKFKNQFTQIENNKWIYFVFRKISSNNVINTSEKYSEIFLHNVALKSNPSKYSGETNRP